MSRFSVSNVGSSLARDSRQPGAVVILPVECRVSRREKPHAGSVCPRRPWWPLTRFSWSLNVKDKESGVRTGGQPRILSSMLQQSPADEPAAWFVGRVRWTKRALDLLLILLCLPVLIPVFLGVAVYIKLVSAGPVFFTQERVGFRGKKFRLFKFRSMKLGSDDGTHELHTTFLYRTNMPLEKRDHVDDRLIPWAWVLRSTGLDELPQLINVIRGDMSLVGPRPCTVYEYEMLLPWHDRRFGVLPGLTGMWQVNGKNRTTFQQMMTYDVAYTQGWSVWRDIRILLQTLPVPFAELRQIIAKRRSGARCCVGAPDQE